ncbi:HpsJ-like protein, cyanoexosortase A-associated [Roseofilum casamattae]|uniref:HpsJ family protein n=1 Tax=Roseofilum casamattae BLCC-M143 TaxID=3022442 RepID=A0ABT7BTT6_9CYAN|nr:HpsJ family protein [Roseofilum casamattae]MDJ1182590.1 HpsJ family protein [Roseofilum casamattae BLCC-M143]
MQKAVERQELSLPLARAIGYCLLVLAIFDFIDTIIPTYFMNPVWEFQAIGELVERVPIPLLGLLLIFYGEKDERKSWEKLVLRCLSWGSLIAGILFLLLIPLGVNDVIRLYYQGQYQIATQITQQNNQMQQMKSQVQNATIEQLDSLIAFYNNQPNVPPLDNAQDLQEVKTKLSSHITQAEDTLRKNSTKMRMTQRLSLMKRSIKWLFGALLAGVLYIRIWKETRWARRSHKRHSRW